MRSCSSVAAARGKAELLHLVDVLRADVAGHDDDRVAEVDLAALGVGELPLSSTCSRMLNTSGCAFSISSNSSTEYGRWRTSSVSAPPSSWPT
jgi:hypothetical protein